jgi:small subunit ribosomal protein S15
MATTKKAKSTKEKTSKTTKAAAKKKDTVVKKSAKKVSSDKVGDLETMSKQDIIQAFATSKEDTGSPEIQIALLTQKILQLAKHLTTHKKDNSSRRGLLQMVGKRRRLLEYLKKKEEGRYSTVITRVGLK